MATPIPPRQPIPLERSIRWVPVSWDARAREGGQSEHSEESRAGGPRFLADARNDNEGRDSSVAALHRNDVQGAALRRNDIDDHAIFITQDALREVDEHARSNAGDEVLGFLLGEQYECPDSGARYVVITTMVPTGHVIAEAEPVQIPDEEWLGIQLEVRRRHLTLVGWYHSAPFVALTPARLDFETQLARFTEPWQCGLVVSSGAQAAGGFFRATSNAFVPFRELLDADSLRGAGGVPRTVIDWRNYVTDADVEREPADGGAASWSAPPMPSGPTTPILIPTGWDGDDTSALPSRQPRRRRPWWMAIAAVIIVAAIVVWSLWARRAPDVFATSASGDVHAAPRAPTTRPARYGASPASPAPSTATSPSLVRFNRLADSLQLATVNYHTRRSDFDLHRIDCTGLARGYRAADDALVALAAMYRDVHLTLSPAQIARFEALGASMDTVNEDFGKTGCPRP